MVFLSLVIILLICKKAIPQLWSWWAELCIVLLGAGSVAGIMAYSYTHLPPMDFRPYKIGNHIPTLMEIPEGAEPDVYETTLIYAKDGVEQEFTLENYPSTDPSWKFVDQKSKLIKKGYVAPIHDFEILNMDFEDLTYDILESEEPVTLIAMYDLNKTDRKQMDKVKQLLEENVLCYILTGSGEAEIEDFCMEYEIDENAFCTIDPVTLKTIVRANPGVFVVQNGYIIDPAGRCSIGYRVERSSKEPEMCRSDRYAVYSLGNS